MRVLLSRCRFEVGFGFELGLGLGLRLELKNVDKYVEVKDAGEHGGWYLVRFGYCAHDAQKTQDGNSPRTRSVCR